MLVRLGVAAGAVTGVLALADIRTPLRPVVTLLFLGLAPGGALVRLLPERDPVARLVLSIALSLALVAGVGQVMLALGTWSPDAGLVVLTILSAAALGISRRRIAALAVGVSDKRSSGRSLSVLARCHAFELAAAASALILWVVSLPAIDPERINDYGLVSAVPPSFFAAIALVVIGFSLAVSRCRMPSALLGVNMAVFILIIHGTLAVVYEAPRYAWVYKHIGVVNYILRNGAVDRSIDLYHNWPGFFALSAFLLSVGGYSATPFSFVSWAQPLFNLLDFLALLFVFQVLTPDRRLIWLAAWLFFATNWIGQDYFAPQALTFFFSIVIFGICLKWLTGPAAMPKAWGDRLFIVGLLVRARRWLTDQRSWEATLSAEPFAKQGAVAVTMVLFLFSIVVVSHQLTPWVIVCQVTALVIFGRCRPRWLPLAMAGLAACWLALVHPAIRHDLLSFGSAGRVTQNVRLADLSQVSTGRVVVALSARTLTAAICVLALLGARRRFRQGHWDLSVAVVGAAAFPVTAIDRYGGEVLFRAVLFSLPWLSFFAAAALYPFRHKPVKPLLASSLLVGCLFLAYFGLERANYIRQGDIEAARYVYRSLPAGSMVMLVADNFPTRLEANYGEYAEFRDEPSLLELPSFAGRQLTAAFVCQVLRELGVYQRAYVVFSRSQSAYAELMNLSPQGSVDGLQRAMMSSEYFHVVYRNRDAVVFERVGNAGPEGSCHTRT